MSVPIPARVKVIVQALYERNLELANGDDDQRRALIMKCAQQVRFELGERWGTKRAGEGRPPSKDALAYFDGAMLFSADCFNGSTRKPDVPDFLEPVPGQVFIAVSPINHLSAPPVDPPPPPPPTDDLRQLVAALTENMEAFRRAAQSKINELEGKSIVAEARLKDLEEKEPPVVTIPPLKVKGKTTAAGGGWWGKSHVHDYEADVIPK